MPNLLGQSLGRYHILEQIGEGGMAIVYKAFDTRLETDVAVKVIRTNQLAPAILERALKRFEREAKALARLTHANIVNVSDYGEEEGLPYLVMPFLPGGTLKEKLRAEGKIGWQDASRLLLPVAKALAYAHEEEMVHRDVKPANILITRSGDPMLTDFGIAKIIDEEATMDLTGTRATVGTPEYMAPEQVTAKTVDHRADIYALGVVLYEMVTGRKPFQADTPMAVLVKLSSEPLPRPTEFAPKLPQAVENILLKALAKDPANRYQNMGEFVVALEKFLHGKTSLEKKPTPKIFPGAPKWVWWAIVVVVGIGFAGVMLGRIDTSQLITAFPTETNKLSPTLTTTQQQTPLITNTPLQVTQTPLAIAQWAEGEILFQDDFEDGNTDGWLKHEGQWKVIQDETGNHVLQGNDVDFARIEAGRLYWDNYAFEVMVKVVSKSKSPGGETINLFFRENPNCDSYKLLIFNTRVHLLRVNSGNNCISTSLDGQSINLPFNEWITFRIEISNDIIRYLIDGTEIFLFTDSQPIFKGTISLAVQENGVVWFDNVQVTELIQTAENP
jgi:serine/threonine protein kinase